MKRSLDIGVREIARQASVSAASVSRTVNRIPTVNSTLARRVRRVIDEIGYFPNVLARALVSGRTRTLGLVVSRITDLSSAAVIQSFEDLAIQGGYEILLASTADDPERIRLARRRMLERRVDGVAFLAPGADGTLADDLHSHRLPLVVLDAKPSLGIANIRIDYLQGIRQAVQHLAALRHVWIAFVAGPPHLRLAVAQKEAFQKSMRELGLQVQAHMLTAECHSFEGGVRVFAKFARSRHFPTAILCSSDMTAVGIMRQAYEHDIRVPQDLSVIAFDYFGLGGFMAPSLTSIQMSQRELATLAFNALIRSIEQESTGLERTEYLLSTNLVLRQSTALACGKRAPDLMPRADARIGMSSKVEGKYRSSYG